ncbi:carboxypeptidase-like regulatory domain-containing protein [Mucilaginibacter sp. UYCu711]|uniref:carboxypeptidase-like regulatory domain-containing protein n=1 Tax=Mucilaginibacter sp. UYCu711 TaxID=3156339 RepID=UPI003D1A5BE8
MIRLNYRYILLLLNFLPAFCFGQAVYQGQVINAITETPVGDVNVTLIKAKSTTKTNEHGYFRLIVDHNIANDTLAFTYVGYKTFLLPLSLYQNQIFIPLTPANNQLAQVNIRSGELKTETLDRFGVSDIKDLMNDYYAIYRTAPFYTPGTFAKLFTAPAPNALLTTIALGRRDLDIPDKLVNFPLATSNKYARFLIHVMTCDTISGQPDQKIFTKEIVLNDNSLKVTIDLKDEKIVIPADKFFIAVEWLKVIRNEVIKLDVENKVRRTTKKGKQLLQDASEYTIMYQPFLTLFPGSKRTYGWISKDNVKWQPMSTNWQLALSATVRY